MVNREWGIEIDPECGDDLTFGFAEDDGVAPITDYRDLDVWKAAMSFAAAVYRETAGFPIDERFGLTAQLRRAAVSVPANIAEGYGRETAGAYIQFLRVSQGSAKELETLVELSHTLGFLRLEQKTDLFVTLTRISKMLRALIRALERKRQ